MTDGHENEWVKSSEMEFYKQSANARGIQGTFYEIWEVFCGSSEKIETLSLINVFKTSTISK